MISNAGKCIRNMNDKDKTEQKPINENAEESSAIVSPFSSDEATNGDSSLQSLVNEEQTFARERLREESGREPTQEEINRWLSAQTEGY